mgnify:CR=1 FL=1
MLRLTIERQKKGWSKSELARRADTPLSHLSRVESGKAEPYEPVKNRLSNVLGIPEEELLEEVDDDGNDS